MYMIVIMKYRKYTGKCIANIYCRFECLEDETFSPKSRLKFVHTRKKMKTSKFLYVYFFPTFYPIVVI